MLYNEYLRCAEKHLKSCRAFLNAYKPEKNSDFEVFLEIFYITGYVLEGLTIYSTYKLYGWQPDKDITEYDEFFVVRTKLDFYRRRPIPTVNHTLQVQSHYFQEIAKNLLVNQGPFVNDNSTPFFGNGRMDDDVRLLIERWKPEVRYYYKGHSLVSCIPTLNFDLIERLVETCTMIFAQTICRVGI